MRRVSGLSDLSGAFFWLRRQIFCSQGGGVSFSSEKVTRRPVCDAHRFLPAVQGWLAVGWQLFCVCLPGEWDYFLAVSGGELESWPMVIQRHADGLALSALMAGKLKKREGFGAI